MVTHVVVPGRYLMQPEGPTPTTSSAAFQMATRRWWGSEAMRCQEGRSRGSLAFRVNPFVTALLCRAIHSLHPSDITSLMLN